MKYNTECALFALTSAELPGLLLAGKDPAKLWADVPAVIKALYRAPDVVASADFSGQEKALNALR
jgi:hypothetical protein